MHLPKYCDNNQNSDISVSILKQRVRVWQFVIIEIIGDLIDSSNHIWSYSILTLFIRHALMLWFFWTLENVIKIKSCSTSDAPHIWKHSKFSIIWQKISIWILFFWSMRFFTQEPHAGFYYSETSRNVISCRSFSIYFKTNNFYWIPLNFIEVQVEATILTSFIQFSSKSIMKY